VDGDGDWTLDGDRVQSLKCNFNKNLDNDKIYISLLIHRVQCPSFDLRMVTDPVSKMHCSVQNIRWTTSRHPVILTADERFKWISVNISDSAISMEQVEMATSVIVMFM
jgi:hypothetical protein